MAMIAEQQRLVKISLNLPEDVYAAVRQVAERRNVTQTEVIRRAISIEKFLEDLREESGGTLELQVRVKGKLRQIFFPWLA